MRSRIVASFIALVGGIVLGAGPAHAADLGNDGIDKDCSHFSTQEAAQSYFNNDGGSASRNVDLLDSDGDGKVCESLPSSGGGGTGGGTTFTHYAYVTSITDGDTFKAKSKSGVIYTVRMLGINTPEYGKCGYTFATNKLKYFLPVGKLAKLTSDPTQANKDKYGRLLRYVTLSSRDVNKAQLYVGAARVYVNVYDPFKRYSTYKSTQSAAKSANRGLWAFCW